MHKNFEKGDIIWILGYQNLFILNEYLDFDEPYLFPDPVDKNVPNPDVQGIDESGFALHSEGMRIWNYPIAFHATFDNAKKLIPLCTGHGALQLPSDFTSAEIKSLDQLVLDCNKAAFFKSN